MKLFVFEDLVKKGDIQDDIKKMVCTDGCGSGFLVGDSGGCRVCYGGSKWRDYADLQGTIKNASEGIVWILNGPRDEMIFINDDQKTYSRGATDEYCNTLSATFEQMMKGVPEEQRKMMEQMMTKGKEPSRQDVSIVKSGDGGTIAGYKTVKYKVLVGGELFKEIWLTLDLSLMKEYKQLIPVLKKFNSCTNSMEMESSPENTPEYQKLWEAGFELKSVRYEEGNPEPETNVVQLEKKTIPESEFKVPSGYKQVSFAELLKAPME